MSLVLLKRLMSSMSSSTVVDSSRGWALKRVVGELEKFASTSLAEKWDNVGLLVEPTAPKNVSTLLLTNDLTEQVMDEALDEKADLIVSYHPPVFAALKRITQQPWKERLVVRAIENRIGIFSPHTSWDAMPRGVNDWLLSAFKEHLKSSEPASGPPPATATRLQTRVSSPSEVEPLRKLVDQCGASILFITQDPSTGAMKVEIEPGKGGARALVEAGVGSTLGTPLESFEVTAGPAGFSSNASSSSCCDALGTGGGRVGTLGKAVTLEQAVQLVKSHLGLSHVRLAVGKGKTLSSPVTRVGVCAGSGVSILAKCKNKVDLFLTGEMSHHEVLDFVQQQGGSIILCDHSNTERGFLKVVQDHLSRVFDGEVRVVVSQKDADPLVVV